MSVHVDKILLIFISILFGTIAAVFRFMAALYDDVQKDVHAERHRGWFRRCASYLKQSPWVGLIKAGLRFFVSLPSLLPTSISAVLNEDSSIYYPTARSALVSTRVAEEGDPNHPPGTIIKTYTSVIEQDNIRVVLARIFGRFLQRYISIVLLLILLAIGPALAFYISGVPVGMLVVVLTIIWGLLLLFSVLADRHEFRGVIIIGPLTLLCWIYLLIEGARLPFMYLPLYALAVFPIFLSGASEAMAIIILILMIPILIFRRGGAADDDDDDDWDDDETKTPSYILAGFWLIVSYFLAGVFVTVGQITSNERSLIPTLQMLVSNAICDSISLTIATTMLSCALRARKIAVVFAAFVGCLAISGVLAIASVYLSVFETPRALSLTQCWYVFSSLGQTHGIVGAIEYQCLMYTTFALVLVYTITIIGLSLAKLLVDLANWFVARLVLNNKPLALMSAVTAMVAFFAGSGATLIGLIYSK